jgi:hypothetical protein
MWNKTVNLFHYEMDRQFQTISNFETIQSLLDFEEVVGNMLWAFDWFANRTFLSYSNLIAQNLGEFLGSSAVQVNSKNVSGYLSASGGINLTESEANAIAIISLLDLYNRTANPIYLDLANNTWLYLNATFWDPVNIGYKPTNATTDLYKDIYGNAFTILANLAVNSTLAFNSSILFAGE